MTLSQVPTCAASRHERGGRTVSPDHGLIRRTNCAPHGGRSAWSIVMRLLVVALTALAFARARAFASSLFDPRDPFVSSLGPLAGAPRGAVGGIAPSTPMGAWRIRR